MSRTNRLVLSSLYKQPGESDSDFTNVLAQHVSFRSLRLKTAIIPTGYQLQDEVITWEDSTGTDRTFTLDGNYSSAELITAMTAGFASHQTITPVYSSLTNKITYTSASNFQLRSSQWSPTARYVLGERSTDGSTGTSYTTPDAVNLAYPEWVFCECNFADSSLYLDGELRHGFVVPLVANAGVLTIYEPSESIPINDERHGSGRTMPHTPRIRILTPFGEGLDLHGNHATFIFELKTERSDH
jgi:hypothetical protein